MFFTEVSTAVGVHKLVCFTVIEYCTALVPEGQAPAVVVVELTSRHSKLSENVYTPLISH